MTSKENNQQEGDREANFRLRNFRFPARENAFEKLNQAYSTASRVTDVLRGASQERSSEVVILSGVSGAGKSFLIKQFLSDLRTKAEKENGTVFPYVLTGKYDEAKGGSSPFSGIIEAFSSFAEILEGECAGGACHKEILRLQEAIQDKVGGEACFLTTVIPELVTLVGKQKSQSSSTEEEQEQVQHGNAWNRLRYIFQAFTAAISTEERPVILILDDLQWMDNASLELLQSLLCDQSLKHFMFIGLCRAEEVTAEDKLHVALDHIKKSIDIKEIELSNLNLSEMTEFLSKTLLNKDVDKANISAETNDEIEGLAKAVFDKTQGNIFFALQILDDLQRKEILQYSQSDSSWTWKTDSDDIRGLLAVDLQGIIREKIMSASQILQQVLTIMAYTRSSLDIRSLREIMEQNGWGISLENLVAELKVGETLDLLTNENGSPNYSFAHDNIQQAAYDLIPSGEERTQFRVNMGMRLINLYEKHKNDWLLFAGADHLNATADQKTAKSKFLLKLNVQAGDRAQSVAAFDASSDFLGRAIKIVEAQPDSWQTSYKSTLSLYRNLAAVEFTQGRMDAGNRLADVLLKNATHVHDKVPTLNAMGKALGVEQRHREGVNLCLRTLNLMKMYPKSSLRMNSLFLRDVVAVQRFWKSSTNEQILQLPILRDKRKIAAIEILASAATNSLLLGDDVLILRTVFRSLRLSFQHGLCSHSASAIIGFMIVRIHLGDFDGAKRLAELTRSILKRLKSNQVTTRMLAGVSYYVSGWNQPQLKVLKDFEQGYKAGMACGDHEMAAFNGHGYCILQFLSGYPLSLVEHRFGRLVTELKTNNVHAVRLMAEQSSLSVHILQGKVAFDYDSLVEYGPRREDKSDKQELSYGYVNRTMLGVFFGRYDLSETMLARFKKLSGDDVAATPLSHGIFYTALMYLSLYHDSGNKRDKKRAQPYIQRLEKLNKGLGTNSLHRLMIMKAHDNASKYTTLAAVKQEYDEAINHSIKTGHIQDAGMACQMAAQYLTSKVAMDKANSVNDSVRLAAVRDYWKMAINYYKRWGANGLVDHLQGRHGRAHNAPEDASAQFDMAARFDAPVHEGGQDLPTLFDF